MKTILTSWHGTCKRKVEVQSIHIPDLWHVAMRLRDDGKDEDSELILECWHLCHDLLQDARGIKGA